MPSDEVPGLVELPVPEHWMEDGEVETSNFAYSDRAPTYFVVSGPLADTNAGRGRWFSSWRHADIWARSKYGARLRGRVQEAGEFGRWAYVIKKAD